MLFTVKRRLPPTVMTLALLALGSLLVRHYWSIMWNLAWAPAVAQAVLFGLGVILVSDATLHLCLQLAFGERYLATYQALAEYFRPQGIREIFAGGLLAGLGEELLFRGIVLQGGIQILGLSPVVALCVSAVLFGMAHVIWRWDLAPIGVWAVWEGALLSGIYVWSGSLLVCMLVHAMHDWIGFGIFATERHCNITKEKDA